MSEQSEGRESAHEAPMPSQAEPSQETSQVGSASPSFASPDSEALPSVAAPSEPAAPASIPSEAAGAEKAEATAAAEAASGLAAEAASVEAELGEAESGKAAKDKAQALQLRQELEGIRETLEKMEKDAADRVERHRLQVLGSLGLRKAEYASLAPDGDPATDEGEKALRDWALENPSLFESAPALPSEAEQGKPQLGLLQRRRKTWRDAFGS